MFLSISFTVFWDEGVVSYLDEPEKKHYVDFVQKTDWHQQACSKMMAVRIYCLLYVKSRTNTFKVKCQLSY